MGTEDGISWKTLGIASATVIGTLALSWAGWVSITVINIVNSDKDIAALRKQDESFRAQFISIDGKISSIWRNGIQPLRRFHLGGSNWPEGPVIDSEKD